MKMMRAALSKLPTAALLTAALLCLPLSAGAHPFDLFGAGARASAMGGAGAAAAEGFSAIYYNPAGMTLAGDVMSVGMVFSLDQVRIDMKERPKGYDLPDLGGRSVKIPTRDRLSPRVNVEDIPDLSAFMVGAVGSFGVEAMRVGVTVLLPVNRIGRQASRFPDEREQYFSNRLDFELVGERSQHQVILLALAYRLYPWLSIGGGMSIMPEVTSTSSVYIDDPSQQDRIEVALNNDQVGRAALHAGVVVIPTDNLRFGLSYRGANYLRMKLLNSVQIRGFESDASSFPIEQVSEIVVNYSPDQFTLGGTWQRGRMLLTADALWAIWFNYLNNQGLATHAFHNTLSIRVGTEYETDSKVLFRGGVQWEPSPVPEQSGRTNYVDNHRLVGTVGAGHRVNLFGKDVLLSWYGQVHHLIARDVNKQRLDAPPVCGPGVSALCDEIPDDTPDARTGRAVPAYQGLQTGNPGFPGWVSYGNLLSLGMDMRWSF